MTKKEALEIVKNTPWSFIIDTLFKDGEILDEHWESIVNGAFDVEVPVTDNSIMLPPMGLKAQKEWKEYLDNHLLENSDKEQLLVFLEEAISNEQFEWAEQLKKRIDELET